MEDKNLFDDVKVLRDPIYGYISIPREYMNNIVDTAEFQRLRRIMQTSYSPLYSSALHNRFVHSLGVFYLGTIAAKSLLNANKEKKIIDHDKMIELAKVYTLACLLHDVGHAPFSHTGEVFYNREKLANRLADIVNTESMKNHINSLSQFQTAANHEVMSAIIGIKTFSEYIGDSENQEFFARCITGYTYKDESAPINQVKNCFISMLNSKVIDVDRLDYLIRDAYSAGYDSVNIDYKRLLNSITMVKDGKYKVAFKKNAVSVIENAVYAHDAQKKWIQTHPVVVYEISLLQQIIGKLDEKIGKHHKNKKGSELFSEEALGVAKVSLASHKTVSLLSDDDIVYLSKDILGDEEVCKEFFDRRRRRHPVWKSEVEFNAFFGTLCKKGELRVKFHEFFSQMLGSASFMIFNEDYEKKLKEEKKKQDLLKETGDEDTYEVMSKGLDERLKFVKFLHDEADKAEIPFDYMILKAKVYESDFSKEDLGNVNVVLGDNGKIYKFADVCDILTANQMDKDTNESLYYLFYRRSADANKGITDIPEFCRRMFYNVSGIIVGV